MIFPELGFDEQPAKQVSNRTVDRVMLIIRLRYCWFLLRKKCSMPMTDKVAIVDIKIPP